MTLSQLGWRAPLHAVALALALMTFCAATPRPARADTLTAYVAKSGAVTIQQGESEKTLASVRPGLFETTWQMRGVSTGPDGPVIRASNAGATVTVTPKVTARGNTLTLEYVMTPDKDVSVNSVHVSVNTPATAFVGGNAHVGNGSEMTGVTVPPSAKESRLAGSDGGVAILEKGAARIEAKVSSGQPVLVQDGRYFGGSDLELRFGNQTERVWKAGATEKFVLTVTLPDAVTVVEEKPITLTAGADWIPLELKLDVQPGSALDFSPFFADAPAGKHGRVIVRPDGHFGFEKKDAPVRFYGVNLCFSANYVEKDEADRLADRLARVGYNTVRIHHYEGDLIDREAPNSYTLRKDNLDRLDYLLAAFKKRGIYVKTDLYVSRPVTPAEMGLDQGGMDEFKAAVLVSKPAMDNWKAFTRALLEHVNPYTGLAYKDDPALAFLCVINEPNLTNHFGRFQGKLRALFDAEWKAWLKARYRTDNAVKSAWGVPDASLMAELPRSIEKNKRGRDVAAFLTHLHRRGYAEMKAFLRDEVKCAALLTDLNGWSEDPAFMAARTDLDWVDNHFYWDHPNFLERSWSLPSEGGSGGRGAVETPGAGPNFIAMTRLFGKPFSVSEYNYSVPNRYRAEGGLIMGAASALQDWDAVWRFAYSHSRENMFKPAPLGYFDMATDPAGQAGERAALMLFLRGDLKPAPSAVALVRRAEDLTVKPVENPAGGFNDLTLVTRVGTRVTSAGATPVAGSQKEIRLTDGDGAAALAALQKAGSVPTTNRTDVHTTVRQSETNELFVDGEAGILRIETARTVGGVAPSGGTVLAGPLTAKIANTRAAVWASSLDDKPVAQSARLLLVHLTDVQNSDMRYGAPDRRVLEAWGNLPHLARRGAATVTLAVANPGAKKAWRLDTSGARVAELPVKVEGGRLVLDLATAAPDGKAVLYYEVAEK